MNIFKRLFGARAQYILLNAREEEFKSKRKRLGIQSIILSVIGLIGVIVFVIIGTLLARNVATSSVGEISNAPITSFFGAIVFYAFALSFANYQRHLNKNKIGLASLIISLISILICLLFTIIFVVIML